VKCKVLNGYAQIGDIVTIVSYGDEDRYQYKVTGFQEYQGKPQMKYRRVNTSTMEFWPDTVGSWMDFSEAQNELKLVHKKVAGKVSFWKKLFGF
jgi:hypothetical protein